MAVDVGITPAQLTRMVRAEQLIRPFKGVYVVAGVFDSVELRLAAVRLAVPRRAIVCDHTAAWVFGADLLPAGAHQGVPLLSMYVDPEGSRLRFPHVVSGERGLESWEIVSVDGLLVTSPLRTACDLGRIRDLPRGLANVDGMLRLGLFTKAELVAAAQGFRGQRWVRSLRTVAPMADPRPQSPPESMLRFHWLSSGLPEPVPQHPVLNDEGDELYYLDLLDPVNGVAGEYDGKLFHGAERTQHDVDRRSWIEENRDITIEVFTDVDLFGRNADPVGKLRRAYRHRSYRSSSRHRM